MQTIQSTDGICFDDNKETVAIYGVILKLTQEWQKRKWILFPIFLIFRFHFHFFCLTMIT